MNQAGFPLSAVTLLASRKASAPAIANELLTNWLLRQVKRG